MWGLEYALLFGVPDNKLELLDGLTPLTWPFPDRESGEAHLAHWTETLCDWQGISARPAMRKTAEKWTVEINNFVLDLHRRPIHLDIPFDGDAFLETERSFWRRDLWPNQPRGHETGWEGPQDNFDVAHNLWRLFGEIVRGHGGMQSGRVPIAMTDRDAVEPDQYYFRAGRKECMIDGDYFHGVPHIVAQVLAPATRWLDRGPRREVFRRAGVRQLWLLEPLVEQVELYELASADYELVATYRGGETFAVPGFADTMVNVSELFETQSKRYQRHYSEIPGGDADEPPEPVPTWLFSRAVRLGLAYLLVLGHPKRRFEIWNNRAPCMLAFGSDEEASTRFGHFLEEICRWEQMAKPTALDASKDAAEVGRFRLTRHGHIVRLDVAVDARKYRELLEVSARRESWDWGDD
jgi:hypothetical protein